MDLQFFADEKTEKATPRRREEVRKKGQTAKSTELVTTTNLFISILFIYFLGKYFLIHFMKIFNYAFSNDYLLQDIQISNSKNILGYFLQETIYIIIPIFLLLVIVSIFINYVQVGFIFSSESLKVNLNRINPLEGFKRIFSKRTIYELIKSLLKTFFLFYIIYLSYLKWQNSILTMIKLPLQESASLLAKIFFDLSIKVVIGLLIFSLVDYLYQRFEFEKNIRMSKQEIKDEYKKSEGDPLIKSKRKERQRQLANSRMMANIPKADVIITNPTHYAVALQYNATKMNAPIVIAKGSDYLALKIKELGKLHDVMIMENKILAQTLYKRVEIGEPIPFELFQAVAEILAYVYKVKRKI